MSSYTVNTTSDAVNPGAGLLTLRQAIAAANADPLSDSILFSPSVFFPGTLHTIKLTQGELLMSGTTTIIGPGSNVLTIDANRSTRAFEISSGSLINIDGVTITNGLMATAPGQAALGGAVLNSGGLTFNNDVISNSNASGGGFNDSGSTYSPGAGGAAAGGAIYSTGTLQVNGSTISGNIAQGGSSYFEGGDYPALSTAMGGGIFSSGPLSISGSAITTNTAIGGGGENSAVALGGGVYDSGILSMSATSVSDNTVAGGSGFVSVGAMLSGANGSGGGLCLSGTSTLSSDTFTNNQATGGDTSGGGGSAGTASGGAIFSAGPLSMDSSAMNGNIAVGGDGPYDDNGAGGDAFGAAIAGSDSLNVSSSSITNNVATGGAGQPNTDQLKGGAFGGGIYSTSSLVLATSTLSGNTAQGDPNTLGGDTYAGVGGLGQGGGLYAAGTATISSSTISGNTARGGIGDPPYDAGTAGDGGMARGGGIIEAGDITLTNSTVAANSVIGGAGGAGGYNEGDGGSGGPAYGGGIDVYYGELTASDSTVSGNTAIGGAGGITRNSGYLNGDPGAAAGGGIALTNGYTILDNSIIDANTAAGSNEDDIFGSVAGISENNLIGVGGGQYITNGTNGNIIGVDDPKLSPLQNYGGPTQTMPPMVGSPAINAGSDAVIPAGITSDQRGYARIAGSSVDIGAVEVQYANVSGVVFNDTNGDGVRQTGEPALGGVTIYADLSNSGVYKNGDPTAVSGVNGSYTLTAVPEGTLIIRQNVPAGYRQSYPTGGGGNHVTLTPAGASGVTFADSTRLYVSGTVTLNGVGQGGVLVYADLNNDGKFESGENNKTTGSNGFFAFQGLTPGTYTFRSVPPAGEIISGNAATIVTLGSGGVDQNVSFSLGKQTTSKLTGTVIGTAGSYRNQGNTAANAFDGNLNTYFDGPVATGAWVGLDLGTPKVVTQISFAPRSGWANRMVGGVFQASNSATFTTGVVSLYTVTSTPPTGVLSTVTLQNSTAYRFVRYLGPANSYCNIAEAEFFGATAP